MVCKLDHRSDMQGWQRAQFTGSVLPLQGCDGWVVWTLPGHVLEAKRRVPWNFAILFDAPKPLTAALDLHAHTLSLFSTTHIIRHLFLLLQGCLSITLN